MITAFQQEMVSLQVRLGGTIPNPSDVTWWRKVEVVQGNLTRERADSICQHYWKGHGLVQGWRTKQSGG